MNRLWIVFAVLFCFTACKTSVDNASKKTNNPTLTMASLAGSWDITIVKGEIMPVTTEYQKGPFIEFNLQDQRVHGNSGCNTMNGSYTQKEGQSNSLMLGQMMSTMMACPDMIVERKVLDAIHEVASFQKVDDDEMGLYNEDGEQIIRLKRRVIQ